MSDTKIDIQYDGNNFIYSARVKHSRKGDNYQWKVVDTGDGSNPILSLRIVFNYNGSPFAQAEYDAPVGQYTAKAKSDQAVNHSYNYTVYVITTTVPDGGYPSDDPQIIFDDVVNTTPDASAQLVAIGGSAHNLFSGILSGLMEVGGRRRDADALFFPGGITNISASLQAPGGVSGSVTVSGPPAPTKP